MTQQKGKQGEELVVKYLQELKWTVLERNWRSKFGEIDIIALEKDSIVFLEVKNWPRGRFEDLEIAVGKTKQKKIIETAKYFLEVYRQYKGMYLRFDLVFVQWDLQKFEGTKLKHLKDAFSEFC